MVDRVAPRTLLSGAVDRLLATAPRPAPDFHWHPDTSLPATVALDAATTAPLIEAMGRWAWEIGAGGIASLGLWRGVAEFGDPPGGMVLEAGRRHPGHAPPTAAAGDATLAALREAAARAGLAPPAITTRDGTERIEILFPDVFDAAAAADQPFGRAFSRRRLLLVREPVLTRKRLQRSLALSALDTEFCSDIERAARLIDDRLAEGRPFDFVGLSAATAGPRLDTVVGRLRAREGEPLPRVIVTGAPSGAEVPGADRVLVAGEGREWMLDAIFELVRQPLGPPAATAARSSPEAVPALIGRHILVVEDVAMNRALLEAMLAPTGATLTLAADGRAAIEATRGRAADLVFMDIQLPELDGLQATRAIREIAPAVKVVALTAHARETDRAGFLAAGMDDYLAKPIRVDDLYAAIRRALGVA
ncbi:MAG: response regulator [Paracoccaceae bacterium]